MKKSVKIKNTICIILIAIMLLFATNVHAATNSFKTALSVDKSSAKRGETVTVTIALKDIAIESGEKGIGAYTSNIEFDSSVLEYVSTNGTDKWEDPFYQDKKIVGNTSDGEVVNTEQSIGTITFKVKENAKLGETTIKLTNFAGSNAESDITTNDTSITITIANNNNSGNNQNTQNGSNNNKNEDKIQGILPDTGHPSNIVIYILIGVFAVVAVIYLIRIKLINKKIVK